MSFLDEVRAASIKRSTCTVAAFLAGLPDDLRADVDTAIADSSITISAVVRALDARSLDPPALGNWHRHSRRDCRCG